MNNKLSNISVFKTWCLHRNLLHTLWHFGWRCLFKVPTLAAELLPGIGLISGRYFFKCVKICEHAAHPYRTACWSKQQKLIYTSDISAGMLVDSDYVQQSFNTHIVYGIWNYHHVICLTNYIYNCCNIRSKSHNFTTTLKTTQDISIIHRVRSIFNH